MSSIIISDAIMNGIKGAEIVHEEPTDEYKKLVEKANERIKENKRREAEAWIKASTYVSD